MTTTRQPIMPTARVLIASSANHRGIDPLFVQAYMSDPMQAAVTLLTTFDLAVRLAEFRGRSLMIQLEGPDGQSAYSDAPRPIRVAATIADHMTAREPQRALELYLQTVKDHPEDREWPGIAQAFAFSVLGVTLDLDNEPGADDVEVPADGTDA